VRDLEGERSVSRSILRILTRVALLVAATLVIQTCVLRVTDRPAWLGLATKERGTSLSRASHVVIVLHGYGGDRDDLARVADETQSLGAPESTSYVFAEGPFLAMPARAWWRSPDQREEARRRVSELVDEVIAKAELSPRHVYLAGFSQGAALALEVALSRSDTLGGVVAFSPCRDRFPWSSLAAAHAPIRVVLAHGRGDRVCAFEGSATLQRELTSAGHDARLVSFEGPHRVSAEGESALAAMLRGE
jgi:phospholipase/carboxylesterase